MHAHARDTAHDLAGRRSVAYHRAIAARLDAEPAIVARALARVESWLDAGGPVPEEYARAWRDALRLEMDALSSLLVEETERARALRQVSPFAGELAPRERWRIWREVAARAGGPR